MLIEVKFDGHRWKVLPDPATVKLGSTVEWLFQSKGAPVQAIEWTTYFEQASPFKGMQQIRVSSQGQRIHGRSIDIYDHSTVSSSVIANQEGDFKYGVRALDLATGKVIGDDDPRLIVRS